MKTIKELLNAINTLTAEEIKLDEIETRWTEDLDNEDLENAFDAAYKKVFDLHENIINAIVTATKGMIDAKTARAMMMTKRNDLINICKKFA